MNFWNVDWSWEEWFGGTVCAVEQLFGIDFYILWKHIVITLRNLCWKFVQWGPYCIICFYLLISHHVLCSLLGNVAWYGWLFNSWVSIAWILEEISTIFAHNILDADVSFLIFIFSFVGFWWILVGWVLLLSENADSNWIWNWNATSSFSLVPWEDCPFNLYHILTDFSFVCLIIMFTSFIGFTERFLFDLNDFYPCQLRRFCNK